METHYRLSSCPGLDEVRALRSHPVDLTVAPCAAVSDLSAVRIEKSWSPERLAAIAVLAKAEGGQGATSSAELLLIGCLGEPVLFLIHLSNSNLKSAISRSIGSGWR